MGGVDQLPMMEACFANALPFSVIRPFPAISISGGMAIATDSSDEARSFSANRISRVYLRLPVMPCTGASRPACNKSVMSLKSHMQVLSI